MHDQANEVDNAEVGSSDGGAPPEGPSSAHDDGRRSLSRRSLSRRLALGGLATAAGATLTAVARGTAAAQTATTGPEGTVVATGTAAPQGTAVATGNPSPASGTTTTTTTLPPQRPTQADTALLGFAQSIELAASQLYAQAVPTLTSKLAPTVSAFRDNHQLYGEQLGGMLGRHAPGVANQTLVQQRSAAFGASSESDVLRAMYELEISLAASYSSVLGNLKGTDGAALVASIQPIEARQAVVLGQALNLPNDQLMPVLEGDEPGATVLTPAQYPVAG